MTVRAAVLRAAAVLAVGGVAAGGTAGALLRGVETVDPGRRAAAAMTLVLAGATVVGACFPMRGTSVAERLRGAGVLAAATWAAAAAAGLAAGGGAGSLAAACVPAAVAVVAAGIAGALRRSGLGAASASFAAALLASAPSAAIFVADPWIEWDRGLAEPPSVAPAALVPRENRRAAAVLRISPLAAMTAPGALGVDWQRMPLLYDGPPPSGPGLSVVGQFYPSPSPSPFAWAAAVLGIGAALVAASRPAR